jgi:hypothetical protein
LSQSQTIKSTSSAPTTLTKSLKEQDNTDKNKKEITEDEIKTKMVSYYKSFFIKNEDDNGEYDDEEGKEPDKVVDLKD